MSSRVDDLLAAFKAAGATDLEPADDDKTFVQILSKWTFELDDAGEWSISRWTPSGAGDWEARSLREVAESLLGRARALGLGLPE